MHCWNSTRNMCVPSRHLYAGNKLKADNRVALGGCGRRPTQSRNRRGSIIKQELFPCLQNWRHRCKEERWGKTKLVTLNRMRSWRQNKISLRKNATQMIWIGRAVDSLSLCPSVSVTLFYSIHSFVVYVPGAKTLMNESNLITVQLW
jgi:hypothetical protein